MRIELTCAECGENRFTIIQAMEEDSVVRCSECGREIGTMEDLAKRVTAEVMNRATRHGDKQDSA